MNITQTVIRLMKQDDLLALEWDGEYKHFRRLYTEIYQSTSRGKAIMWVAELPGIGIIGQLFVQLTSSRQELADGVEKAYIYGFRIKPDYRGHGLGRQMMEVAENDLARRRFQRVTLNVSRDNPQARRLYEKLGYQVVGMDPGQWSYLDHLGIRREVHEPAWRMEKLIQPEAPWVNV
jgi:ribosomal protein S18 acetylase RimI-like enzyme